MSRTASFSDLSNMTTEARAARIFFSASWIPTQTGQLHGMLRSMLNRAFDEACGRTRNVYWLGLEQQYWWERHHGGERGPTPFDAAIREALQEAKDKEHAAWEPAAPPKLGNVYFIEGGGFLKIGFAGDVRSRLRELQTSCPHTLAILHSHPGTKFTERQLHQKFSALRSSGEWFRYEGALKEYVEGLRG